MSSSWKATVNELSFDSGCDVLGELHTVEAMSRLQQLDVVAHLALFDEPSLHDYLSLHLGLTRHDAKQWVLVAVGLQSLPLIAEAFRNGELNWTKLALVVQLADGPQDDERLATEAPSLSIHQLKVLVSRKKAGDVTQAQRARQERSVRFRHDDARQRSTIEITVPIDQGIAMEKQTQIRADSFGRDPLTGEYPSPQHAMVDAFCELFFGDDAPRADLLVDLEPAALIGEGKADLEGHTLNKETLQRLACDGSARASFIDEKGLPIALGRKRRLFPSWLSRQIMHRDRGCRFIGCGSTRWLHDHHLQEWEADHGCTDYNNGVKLCDSHHRYMHEGGWKIQGDPDGELEFVRPDGKVLNGRAPKPSDALLERLDDMAARLVERLVDERRDLEELREIEREEQEAAWREVQVRRDRERQEREQQRSAEYEARMQELAQGDSWGNDSWGDPAA